MKKQNVISGSKIKKKSIDQEYCMVNIKSRMSNSLFGHEKGISICMCFNLLLLLLLLLNYALLLIQNTFFVYFIALIFLLIKKQMYSKKIC